MNTELSMINTARNKCRLENRLMLFGATWRNTNKPTNTFLFLDRMLYANELTSRCECVCTPEKAFPTSSLLLVGTHNPATLIKWEEAAKKEGNVPDVHVAGTILWISKANFCYDGVFINVPCWVSDGGFKSPRTSGISQLLALVPSAAKCTTFSEIIEVKPTNNQTFTNWNFLIRCSFIKSLSTNMSQRQMSASSALLEAYWESVYRALLKQQWLGRWARVTMSSCWFWDQLRQYPQVPANLYLRHVQKHFSGLKYTPVLPRVF